MNQLKFVCPGCGQHIEVEKAYSGHKMPCPTCQVEIRVPFSNSPNAIGLPRAELVLEAAASAPASAPVSDPAKPSPVTIDSEAEKTSATDNSSQPATPPATSSPTAPAPTALYCLCPVCQSELRVANEAAKAGSPLPVAELVPKAEPAAPQPQPSSAAPEAAPVPVDKLSIEEREKQIAAARAHHRVELYPSMKPRLAYILNGEKPPPGQVEPPPAPPAAATPPEKDESKTPVEPIRIFTE